LERVGNKRGDPWLGRPERYARRRTDYGSLPSIIYRLLLTDIENALGHTSPTCTPCNHTTSLPPSNQNWKEKKTPNESMKLPIWGQSSQYESERPTGRSKNPTPCPMTQLADARVRVHTLPFDGARCMIRPCVGLQWGPWCFLHCNSGREVSLNQIITSQCCTAVSIDTCTAVARFLCRF